jgi:hypothetical protein
VAGLRPVASFRSVAARWARRKAIAIEALKTRELRGQRAGMQYSRQFNHLSAIACATVALGGAKSRAG